MEYDRNFEQFVSDMVGTRVRCCVSGMVSELVTDDSDLACELYEGPPSYGEYFCEECGTVSGEPGLEKCPECGLEFDDDDFDATDFQEVYEHWVVESDLAYMLREQGETVVDEWGLDIWCRTTTGQSITMDCCVRDIAKKWYTG